MFCVKGASLSIGFVLKRGSEMRLRPSGVSQNVFVRQKTTEISPTENHELEKKRKTNVIHAYIERHTDVYV